VFGSHNAVFGIRAGFSMTKGFQKLSWWYAAPTFRLQQVPTIPTILGEHAADTTCLEQILQQLELGLPNTYTKCSYSAMGAFLRTKATNAVE